MSDPDPSAPFWTVRQVATRLGLAESSVRLLILRRQLGHMRIGPNGGRIAVAPADVAAYLESCRVKAEGPAPRPAAPATPPAHGFEPAARSFMAELRAKRGG